MRLYAFDCLVIHGENIMRKPLQSRFGVGRSVSFAVSAGLMDSGYETGWSRLSTRVYGIIQSGRASLRLRECRCRRIGAQLTTRLIAKKQELAYHIGQVWNVHIPQLHHGHDGLIFTCAESSYVSGTDDKM